MDLIVTYLDIVLHRIREHNEEIPNDFKEFLLGEKAEPSAKRQKTTSREEQCPFLLRVFVKKNADHKYNFDIMAHSPINLRDREEDYANLKKLDTIATEFQLHTW